MTRTSKPGLVAAGVLTLWSVVDLLYLGAMSRGHRVMLGIDGPFAGDQLQYLSWIRESGDHLLVRNMYNGSAENASFVHPMFALSGLLWRAGVPLAIAFQLWKPITVFGLAFAYNRLLKEVLPRNGGHRRLAALLLGLFAASPVLAASHWWGDTNAYRDVLSASGNPAMTTWGYLPAAGAIALLTLMLTLTAGAIDNERNDRSTHSAVAVASLAGFLAAWLHPWEGTIGILVLVPITILAMWSQRSALVLRTTAAPLLGLSLPLGYYLVLARFVPAWSVANAHVAGLRPSLPGLVIALGPLAIVGVWAGRGQARAIDRVVRIWPCAAVGASLMLGTTVPGHFLASAGLPLAALAVEGWPRIARSARSRPALGAAVVVALTLPGGLALANQVFDIQSAGVQPHVVTREEANALEWLDNSEAGEVLASPRLATAIPAATGHPTWYGHPNWTPDFSSRAAAANRLFAGELTPSETAEVIRSSGATYLLVDCSSQVRLDRSLTPASAVKFGCATVFVLKG